MKQLTTVWGENLDPDNVLQEYPRPQMVRSSYLNLNGRWHYSISKGNSEEESGTILVPFSPEAPLSGVGHILKPDEVLHYRKTILLSDDFLKGEKSRCLLHFGAVDQTCEVTMNEGQIGTHVGGYLPFTYDVTELVHAGENELRLDVTDATDTSYHARGKQKLDRGGMWYTPQSGIWQTVWMECVSDPYIEYLKIDPDPDRGSIFLKVIMAGSLADTAVPCRAEAFLKGKKVGQAEFLSGQTAEIQLSDVQRWSPENPVLYDLKIRAGEDEVDSYFAVRRYSVGRDSHGILRFMLNGEPFLFNGLLDQGYYPDGLYTAPSDEAMVSDIRKMKDLGYNLLRKHIKIEPARWYYHCDRLGMTVWQDMVNGGGKYNMDFICKLPNDHMWTGHFLPDIDRRLFARQDRKGRSEYIRELQEMMRWLYNFPCIAAWVPFNEGWGQFSAYAVSKLVRQRDPHRLIDHASGWFDQGGGDMFSIHNYWRKLKVRPDRRRVVALTECGGYSYRIPENSAAENVYGYRIYQNADELTDGIVGLWDDELIPALEDGLGAVVYTQLSDVEDEVNGLVTYDRKELKVREEKIRDMNRRFYEKFREVTS